MTDKQNLFLSDKPNIFISTRTPGVGSAQKSGFSEQGGPFGALLAPWVQTVMQAELLAWKYFPGNILSFGPFPVLCFAEEWGLEWDRLCYSRVSWAFLPFPFTDPFAGYVFIVPLLTLVQAELFISWLYVTICMAAVSDVNSQPSAELKSARDVWCAVLMGHGCLEISDFYRTKGLSCAFRK